MAWIRDLDAAGAESREKRLEEVARQVPLAVMCSATPTHAIHAMIRIEPLTNPPFGSACPSTYTASRSTIHATSSVCAI